VLLWADNIWMGVSVENQQVMHRVDDLRGTGACVKFLSLEPLIGRLPFLDLAGIGWVIVGGESGPGWRSMPVEWVHEIREQCLAARVPFFFKQWAELHPKKLGRLLDGLEWNQYPTRTRRNHG